MNKLPVRKAVIAAAGFGTRFLPQTKAMPKEMMPIIDKPVIQYVVEELVASGITDIIIVTNYHKRAIEDHFDSPNAELTAVLEKSGKLGLLDDVKKISDLANIAYVRQKELLGNIGPVFYAEDWVGGEPFIYTWSDDFINATPLRFRQMIDAYNQYGTSVVSCVEASKDEDYDKYAFVSGTEITPGTIDIDTIIEKPGKAKAPSNMASVSGFLFTSDIFPFIHEQLATRKTDEETQIQDAMQSMIDSSVKVTALKIENAHFYDAGNKLGYLKTIVDFALDNAELKEEFFAYLEEKVTNPQLN
ncbi:NTP transferase domain-containing protein [Pedobacter sp.]|nr:NTP transferase domain-containing protein [Candidatus Saccharibacteria bacterium]